MTKISFPALFKLSLSPYKHFLIFGNDSSVFRRALSFLRHKIPLPLEEKTETSFLASLSYTHSLFSSEQEPSITFVSQASEKILPHLEDQKDKFLIFASEKARAQSKLVTHFASHPTSLAISAYASPLSLEEIHSMTADLSLSSSFKNQLFTLYQNDVEGLTSTLEKIKIFGEGGEDLSNFLEESNLLNEGKGIQDAFLLRDQKKIIQLFSLPGSIESILFLRALIRTFLILFELLSHKKIVWEKLSFPVFFKEKPIFEAAFRLWDIKEVTLFLEKLLSLEQKVKYKAWSSSEVHQSLLNEIVSRETIFKN